MSETEQLERRQRALAPPDRKPPRHDARVALLDRDYRVLTMEILPTLKENGHPWQLNYLLRLIAHRFVDEYLAGRDVGVLPRGYPYLKTDPAGQKRAQ